MNYFYLIVFIILYLILTKKNVENMMVSLDSRIVQAFKCQYGWEPDPSGTGNWIFTGDRKLNPFVGSVGMENILTACECGDIFVGEDKNIDPCKLPKCMKNIPGYQPNCKEKTDENKKSKKKELNKTQYGSEKETAVVRAFLKYIRDISKDKMFIKGDEESENRYDDYLFGEEDGFKKLIRPENKSFEDLREKTDLLKKELADKLSAKKN